MIDVFKIKKGDTIKFRNGEVHTVKEAIFSERTSLRKSQGPKIVLWIERCGKEVCFAYEDFGGLYDSSCRVSSERDIVEHIPAEEDKMVDVFKIKVGDTVKFRNGQVHTVVEATVYEEDWERNQFRRFLEIWIDLDNGRTDFSYGNSNGSCYNVGQSAWDIVEHIPNQGEEEPAQDEMTIRDQFAMSAMSGMLARDRKTPLYEDLARWSYNIADAMMKARKEDA